MRTLAMIKILYALCANLLAGSGDAVDSSSAFKQSFLYESQGKILPAIEALSGPYRTSQEDYLLNLRLGWLFRIQGSYLNSKKHYLAAEKAKPMELDAQLGLFYLFLENNKIEDALTKGRQILSHHPKELNVAEQMRRLEVNHFK
jgi:hypothetical protein